jgi:ELWxxDGT repeat protein
MSNRKPTRRFERLENRVLPALSAEMFALLGTNGAFVDKVTDVGGKVFFVANDGVHGAELWVTNGTAAGTLMLKDINPNGGSSANYLTNVGGTLFFSAFDPTNGSELWKSNGTPAGTTIVANINPTAGDGSSPSAFANVNGTLFFAADDGTNGTELWKSNGTGGGTMQVADIHPGSTGSVPRELTNVNGLLYFRADGALLVWSCGGRTGPKWGRWKSRTSISVSIRFRHTSRTSTAPYSSRPTTAPMGSNFGNPTAPRSTQ